LKNRIWGFGRGWRKRTHKRWGNKGGTEGGWRWLVNGSGYKGSSPSEESKRCMTVCIPGSILTLTTRHVFEMEAREWGGIRISVDTFMQESRSPYTLYLLAHSSYIDIPFSATLGFSRMVNDNKEVTLS
jgi:hypothetical protein